MSSPLSELAPQVIPPPGFSQRTTAKSELPSWLLVILGCLALVDFSLNPIMEGVKSPHDIGFYWGFVVIGSLGGQAGILAIAAVLGPSFALRRHLVALALFALFAGTWLLGFVVSHNIHLRSFPTFQGVVAVMLVLPLLFCVGEFPLWIFRTILRWRIESPTDSRDRPPQLTIAGILAATAAVALSLGAVRLGQKLSGDSNESSWWFEVTIAVAYSGGISVLVLPVVTGLVFRTQSLIIGLLLSAAWIGLLILAFVMVVSSLAGRFPTRELHLFVFIYTGFCATLLGPLALCRKFGYRLHWGNAINSALPAAGK